MNTLDFDPATLDNATLTAMLESHSRALLSASLVFEKTIVLAMGTDSQSNHEGFSRWAVDNMSAVEGWQQCPQLRTAWRDLKSELDRRCVDKLMAGIADAWTN
jgi:hypothetical protein